MSAAEDYLLKLFRRAEAAQARGKSERIRLPLTQAQCPDYFAMRHMADAEEFRAKLAVAEHKGAIVLHPASRQVAPRDVAAISVRDLSILGAHLGQELRSVQVAQASAELLPYRDHYSVIDAMLESWRRGKNVRGKAPAVDIRGRLLDAIRVMQARHQRTVDVLMRRESIRLFRNSKRIEQLQTWLDVLYANDIRPSGLEHDHVFAALGLHREPQPLTVSGERAWVHAKDLKTQLFRPYHSLPMSSILGFSFDKAPSYLLTVENKQTFHEMALQSANTDVCLLFTGGMPSPAWHRLYGLLLQALPAQVPVCHFGDLDVGGLRIAHAIAQTAKAFDRRLHPWLMDPLQLEKQGYVLYEATPAQVTAMKEWCIKIGWDALGDRITRIPGKLEQESIVWPLTQHQPFAEQG